MKSSSGRYAVLVVALGTATLFAMIHTHTSHQAAGASLQQPGLPLSVMFDSSNLDQTTRQLYQAMQDALDGYAVTIDARTAYYSAVDNVNGYTVNGWQGIITDVEQNANGYLVSIDVVPGLSADWTACAVIVDSDYSEQYQVNNDGSVVYVGSLDPKGLAGQMPTMMGF